MAAKQNLDNSKQTLETTLSSIRKEFGDIILDGSMLSELEGAVIPTTLSLDIALNGGLAEGTVTSIGGLPGTGKTTLVLEMIAQAQKMGKKCYYADVESRLRTDLLQCIDGLIYNDEQAEQTGLKKLEIIKSTSGNILNAQKFLNIIDKLLKSEEGVVVVLDSVAALCGDASFTKNIGDAKAVADIPRLMYDALRRWAQTVPVNKANLILISHLQANPMGYGGMVEVGGNAIKYFASNRLTCNSSTEVPANSEPKTGRDSVFKVIKCALGPPSGKATIYIRYGKGCDREVDLVETAENLGIIDKSGAWYKFTDYNNEEQKVQGKENLALVLKSDDRMFAHLDNQVREMVF